MNTAKPEHNHPVSNSLMIYGVCPMCDAYYQKVIVEATEAERLSGTVLSH